MASGIEGNATAVDERNEKKGRSKEYRLDHYPMNNEKFFSFYRSQPIIPSEEFEKFVETLKTPLPASFRIQMSLSECELVDEYLNKEYFEKIAQITDGSISPPEKLSFVPYGYQCDAPRAVMRSHPILRDLQQFLVNETEIGVISRQEAVSMIPPLLLDVKPEHFVLDLCAAPGSKTMQLIELMHKNEDNPSGIVVANDIDYNRCYLLVHQTLKRLPIGNCVVVSQDASQFPTVVDDEKKPVLFDRVLCDVICTGDGTFRKNIELWKTWDPQKALNLHKIQIHIAKRGMELLKPGGKMVYSTCSLNPMEDEAVICYLLRHYKGKIRLVDVSNELPKLVRKSGISNWKVFDRDMKEYPDYSSVPELMKKTIVESMFPPTEEEANEFHLDRSFRILPHSQNTGGFFVAVIEKIESFDTDSHVWKSAPRGPLRRQYRRRVVKEDPFVFLNEKDYEDIKKDMENHFGLDSGFPYKQLLIRSKEAEKKKIVYYVNEKLREFMMNNEDRFKVVNAGIGILRRVDKISASRYRLMQDGLSVLAPIISKRIVELSLEDAAKIIAGTNDKHYCSLDELDNPKELEKMEAGSAVIRINEGNFKTDICAWVGAKTATAFISREEKIHCLIMMGKDATKLRNLSLSVRQKKGNGGRKVEEENVDEKNEDSIDEPEIKKPCIGDNDWEVVD